MQLYKQIFVEKYEILPLFNGQFGGCGTLNSIGTGENIMLWTLVIIINVDYNKQIKNNNA